MATYTSALKPQVIYVFAIDTPLHKGCLKIGMTSLTEDCKHTPGPNDPLLNDIARKRIDQYTKTAAIKYELLYTECSAFIYNGVLQTFNDKQVHEILRRSGIRRPEFSNSHFGTEWYETDLDTVKKAIAAAKEGRTCLSPDEKTQNVPAPIVFRPEQRAAIDMAVKRFTKKGGSGSRQVLWNCKMRFGKTLSALQVVREINAQRTLIVTHRPVVNAGWYEDFEKIFYDCCTTETKSPSATAVGSAKHDKQPARFNYGSATQGESLAQLLRQAEKGMHIIGFASMQDLRGSETVGGQHEKNDNVFATEWDLLIIDEAHEGTQTELGQNVIDALKHANTKVLQLSGTPFNLIDQYAEEEIFTWDYIMEQRAKMSWDEYHLGDPNPYAALPAMHIYTYDLGNLLADFVDEDKVFNFREFFRTDERGAFVHDDYVGDFLNLLCRNDEDSLYPYANAEFRHIFRHTLWVLPGVKAAKALSQKLQAHPVFGAFTVVNVAGDGDVDEESRDALEKVNKAIGKDPGATQTITLSCGRLTTGVSIRAWTGVFMMSGASSTSAAGYMQTIFRVQTPFTYQGRMKENCYAFDFAPDRALRMLAEASKVSPKAGKQTDEDRHTLADFLHFCPVIAIEGSRMQAFNVDNLLTQLKRVQIERVVNAGFEDGALYNDELLRLEDGDVADFNDLRAKIGTTKALKSVDKVKVSDNGLDGNPAQPPAASDKKPPKESDPEAEALKALENEKKKQRKNAIAILRGISIRMPLLIYGADIQDEAAELTINNFTHLVDDTSWAEFMPAGVTKADFARFRRYYDPEVFSAAGRRIRQLARSADKFTIEERISRLATLFSTFRNPDKETVLTPWRVVNMHLSDSLGGYCFMDERFEHALETPRHIVRSGVTDRVFSPRSTVLEINSKSGLYPLYAAYSIYRARLDEEWCKHNAIAPGRAKALWEQTLKENIFVVCKTPMAVAITKRTLCGFNTAQVNAQYYPDLIQSLTHSSQDVVSNLRDAKGFWGLNDKKEMKIDAIIGNPPYQVVVAQKETANGQKAVVNVFHYFQMLSDQLQPRYSSLIYPAVRWIHRSGKGLIEFGLKQINDPHLARLHFYPNSNEVFREVGIADGLSVVFKDREKQKTGFDYLYTKNGVTTATHADAPGENMLVLDPEAVAIGENIQHITAQRFAFLHDAVLPRSLFSIESNFVENHPDKVRPYRKGEALAADEIKLLTNDKAGKAGRARWYVAKEEVVTTGKEHLRRWKVVVSSANAGGQKRSNQLEVLDDRSAFGRSRVALKTFATEREARNFFAYCQTDFIRYTFLLTDESLSSLAKMVPDLLDYTDGNGIIDYAGDVNAQLYALFEVDDSMKRLILRTLEENQS